MDWWIVYIVIGLAVGLIAGMLGVGGGSTLVPLMVITFSAQLFPEDRVLHLALGTTITSILFTSVSSFLGHHRHGAVNWELVRQASPGLLSGTLLGTFFADALDSKHLGIFFVIFVYYSAAKLFSDRQPAAGRHLPNLPILIISTIIIGIISSLVGIGGGAITIPLMILCNIDVKKAVGTSAALGFPIAVAGAIGYIYNGLDEPNLPEFSLGYIYLPALIGVVAGTLVTVPIGVKLAHSMPSKYLRKIFAGLLFILASQMAWSLFL